MEEDNGGDKKCDGFLTLTCSQTFLWICDVFGNPLMEQQLGNRSYNLFSIFQTPFAVQMMGMWASCRWWNFEEIQVTSNQRLKNDIPCAKAALELGYTIGVKTKFSLTPG